MRIPIALLPWIAVTIATPALAVEGEVRAAWIESPVEGGSSVSTAALAIRIGAGDRVDWWAAASVVRMDDPWGVAWTPLGAAPVEAGPRDQRRRGAAGQPAATDVLQSGEAVVGWGDLRFGVGATLAGGGARLYRVRGDLVVKAPTADEAEGLGTGRWDAGLALEAERRFWASSAFAGAGWYRLGDPEWVDLRDPPEAWAGVETEPGRGGRLWSAWVEAAGEVLPGAGSRAAIGLGVRGSAAAHWRATVVVGLTDATADLAVGLAHSWRRGTGRRPERRSPPEIR